MIVFQTFHFYGPTPEQDLRKATSPPWAYHTEGAWFAIGCGWGGPTQTTATMTATGETQIPSGLTVPPMVTPTSEAISLVNVFPDLHLLLTLPGPSLPLSTRVLQHSLRWKTSSSKPHPHLAIRRKPHPGLSHHTPSSSKTSKLGIHSRKHRKSNQSLRNQSNPDCGSQPIITDLKATISVKWVRIRNVEALSPDHELEEPSSWLIFVVYKNPIKQTVLQELSITASSKGGGDECVLQIECGDLKWQKCTSPGSKSWWPHL